MIRRTRFPSLVPGWLATAMLPGLAAASSHMDAPLITLDDAVNTTDVYAFVSTNPDGVKVLTTALSVYPFEEPGVGPNVYRFDATASYAIHISLGADLASGAPTYSYFFQFFDWIKNRNTILQAYLGVIKDIGDGAQNLTQAYNVIAIDWHAATAKTVGQWLVPPNNQGIATPEYNQSGGTGPAKPGVAQAVQLDKYTRQGVR